ncbi:methyltransferase domain-containing protein [Nocardioides sp. W7]|uniref:class I SAM-dependent methyltransferase n=1 Tax=Nocardioides sp. W7 TaxID=2931390 RepID=UPI001FD29261|nr:methyltransferase domain-containing protein [Nocardioides sp. W7]
MSWWDEHVVPRLTDAPLSRPPVMELREQACRELRGRVLEIGFGSGLNLGCYPDEVESIDAVEPSDLGWARSEARRTSSRVPVARTGLDGQRLAAADASYDAALSTFTLCTIPDAARAVAEVRRVLRPGGVFCFLEHGLAPDARVAAWQRRLDPVQGAVFGGCQLSRDTPAMLREAGLVVEELDQHYLDGPSVMRPWIYANLGRAARVP